MSSASSSASPTGPERWPSRDSGAALGDEIWYVDLDRPERRRRLVERHVRFGKDPHDAVP